MSAFTDLLIGGNEVHGHFQKYVEAARGEGELHSFGEDVWAISFPACKFLITSSKTDAAGTNVEYFGGQVDPLLRIQENWVETSRGRAHKHRRAISGSAFRDKALNSCIRKRFPVLASEYLDRLGSDFSGDFVSAYARPVFERLALEWIGIPPRLADRFIDTLRKLGQTVWIEVGTKVDDGAPPIREVNAALDDLLPDLLDCWRVNGFDGGLGAALRAVNDGAADPLSEIEAISCILNFGFNANLLEAEISGAVVEMLSEASAQSSAILTADADALIWELFRLGTPAPLLMRRAEEDFSYEGTEIAAGQWIVLHIGAALRDPRHFTEPGAAADLTRRPSSLAFGAGAHMCLGRRPAFDLARSVLRTIWTRFDIKTDGEIDWVKGPYRVVRTLPVRMAQRI